MRAASGREGGVSVNQPEVNIESEERVELLSVGVDIGSATSHMVFSRITVEKVGTRYVTVGRDALYESPIILTPYDGPDLIDPAAMSAYVDAQFAAATQVSGEPTPVLAGTTQSMTVTGLTTGTTYFFVMKAADEAGNGPIERSPVEIHDAFTQGRDEFFAQGVVQRLQILKAAFLLIQINRDVLIKGPRAQRDDLDGQAIPRFQGQEGVQDVLVLFSQMPFDPQEIVRFQVVA